MKALLFKTGIETFALDFNQIQKVLESPELYPIPLAPSFFRGALNFHNHIIPVLDLAAYLNIFTQEQDARVIILDLRQYRLALSVGSIENHIVLEEVRPLPGTSNSALASVSRLVVSEEGRPVRILEPAHLKNCLASGILAKGGNAWYLFQPAPPESDKGEPAGLSEETTTSAASVGFSLPFEPQSSKR